MSEAIDNLKRLKNKIEEEQKLINGKKDAATLVIMLQEYYEAASSRSKTGWNNDHNRESLEGREAFDWLIKLIPEKQRLFLIGHGGYMGYHASTHFTYLFLINDNTILDLNLTERIDEKSNKATYRVFTNTYGCENSPIIKTDSENEKVLVCDGDKTLFEGTSKEDYEKYNGNRMLDALGIVDLKSLINQLREQYGIQDGIQL